jgi:hypothetical protein
VSKGNCSSQKPLLTTGIWTRDWFRSLDLRPLRPAGLYYYIYSFLCTETTLAALYSSEGSVMERHHLSQAMCILNTEGCDILETLPRKEYDRALMLLKDYILASDLANYFK